MKLLKQITRLNETYNHVIVSSTHIHACSSVLWIEALETTIYLKIKKQKKEIITGVFRATIDIIN